MTKNQYAALSAALILTGWVAFDFIAGLNGGGISLCGKESSACIMLIAGLGFGFWMSSAFGNSNHKTESAERAARKKNMKLGWAVALPHIILWGYMCLYYNDFNSSVPAVEAVFLMEGFVFGLTPMLLGFADEPCRERRRAQKELLDAV